MGIDVKAFMPGKISELLAKFRLSEDRRTYTRRQGCRVRGLGSGSYPWASREKVHIAEADSGQPGVECGLAAVLGLLA
jgi:hypothetical protein